MSAFDRSSISKAIVLKWIPRSYKPDSVIRTKFDSEVIHLSINARIDPSNGGCDVPETIRRATWFPISPCIGLGLHCPSSRLGGGGLLPHHFNLTFERRRYVFCCTCRELALTQAPPAFTGNPALRCPDFPLPEQKLEQRMTASRKLIVSFDLCLMNIIYSKDLQTMRTGYLSM